MAQEALQGIEFSDKPSILIVADSQAGFERARRSAALSGCRVAGAEEIGEAAGRLERQASLDAVFLDLEHDHGPPLDHIFASLQEAGETGRYGSVVSAPLALMDRVAAQAWHRRVELVSEADDLDLAAALRMASSRPRHRLHDIGSEQGTPQLQQISQEVRRIASALERISADDTKSEDAPARAGEDAARSVDAGAVRAIIRARRLRDQFFGPDLFADPAWDILLDLYAAHLEKQRVAVSSLCIAAAVPATTALRWIKTLTDIGLLVRAADPQDGRRVYIELAPEAADGLRAYLGAAQRISTLTL